MEIFSGNSPDYSSNEILRKFSTRSSYYDHAIINQRGRYVSMELAETGVLIICEIFVFTLPFGKLEYFHYLHTPKSVAQLLHQNFNLILDG